MRDITSENFGLIIAILLPGFVALWGLKSLIPPINSWLGVSMTMAPTVGGFLYATLGSVAAGMFVSAVRWALIDTIHHRTGIPAPDWDFRRFSERASAFDSMVQDHYRYYQHYSNMLVALALLYASQLWAGRFLPAYGHWTDIAFLLVGGIFFFASRDAFRKYYERTASVLNAGPDNSDS